MAIDSTSILQRNDSVIFSDIDDQVVMMDLDTGDYFELNDVGTRIWELLEQPQTADGLIRALLAEFEITEETCRTETAKFLSDMVKLNTIQVN